MTDIKEDKRDRLQTDIKVLEEALNPLLTRRFELGELINKYHLELEDIRENIYNIDYVIEKKKIELEEIPEI